MKPNLLHGYKSYKMERSKTVFNERISKKQSYKLENINRKLHEAFFTESKMWTTLALDSADCCSPFLLFPHRH